MKGGVLLLAALVLAAIAFQLHLHERALSFDEETRDDAWAPAMEAAMRRRLDPSLLASLGLAEVTITELVCRETTCRLVYEYPVQLAVLVAARGLPPSTSPLALLEEQEGPPAPVNLGWRREELWREHTPFIRLSADFRLDGDAHDPARYDEWARAQLPRTRETFRRMRERWRKQTAGHAG